MVWAMIVVGFDGVDCGSSIGFDGVSCFSNWV